MEQGTCLLLPAMREEIKRRAAARGQQGSVLGLEAWQLCCDRRGEYGSGDDGVLDHMRVDVGRDRRVGGLLLVDAPHLCPARRLADGAAGTGPDAACHFT